MDELLEIVQSLRKELARRDEFVAGDWVESTAQELREGRKVGWFYPASVGAGVAFYSASGREAFGHVHVASGPTAADRGIRLVTALMDGLPVEVESLDLGFTGLSPEEERELTARASARPGSRVIERWLMERELGPADERYSPVPPNRLSLVPIRAVTVEALADLDRRAFVGTIDELLIGPSPHDYRRVLTALLDGGLGRFVDEASTALIVAEPPRLVGAILTGEQSPRRAVFLDFMVDPADRRRGYGRFLFQWGLRALRALGYSSVRLWVTSSNVGARRLYEENGLKVSAIASIYRWDRPGVEPQPHSAR